MTVRTDPETDKTPYQLAQDKTVYVNPNEYFGDPGRINRAVINHFMDEVDQPSERTVRDAIIWKHSDGEVRLQYKAGGESMNASHYEGSLAILNENDEWDVLMRTYSTDFSDVLIDNFRLKETMLDHAADDQTTSYVHQQIETMISYVRRNDVSRDEFEDMMEYQGRFVDTETHKSLLEEKLEDFQDLDESVETSIREAFDRYTKMLEESDKPSPSPT